MRPHAGAHPASGDMMLFAPRLLITAQEIDRFVDASREAAKAVFGE